MQLNIQSEPRLSVAKQERSGSPGMESFLVATTVGRHLLQSLMPPPCSGLCELWQCRRHLFVPDFRAG